MALSDFDRKLLERCLGRKPRAWEDFVDRYTGLVMHVINHSAQARSMKPAISAASRSATARAGGRPRRARVAVVVWDMG